MAAVAKTVVATGVSSGLGFEVIKQLLAQTQPYKVILGARNTQRTQAAFDELTYDRDAHSLTVLPCELADLKDVRSFAQQTLSKLGKGNVDYLMLNAGIAAAADKPAMHGSKWSESLIVNHYSQFYLVHLLREKLESSKSRIVFVSSGGVRAVSDPAVLDNDVKAGSGVDAGTQYCETKFVQLLGAHWWRRQLTGVCNVVAVSPGLIPGTGLGGSLGIGSSSPDAKPIPEGASNILRAFWRDDFPEDPEQIFLTSWGEWWSKDVYGLTLDKALQDKWSPSQEQLEKDEGITA